MHKDTPLLLPAGIVLTACVAGFLGYKTELSLTFLFVPIVIFLIGTGLISKNVWRGMVFSGLFIIFFFYAFKKAHHITGFLHKMVREDYLEAVGTLYRSPQFGRDRTYFFLKTEKMYVPEEIFVKEKVKISVRGKITGFYRWNRIRINFRIAPSSHPCNFGVNRENKFLASGVSAYGYCKSGLLLEKLKSSFSDFFYSIKEKAQLRAMQLPEPAASFVMALIIANRSFMDPAHNKILKTAGIYHFMAISGAHVGIIVFIFWHLLRFIGVKRKFIYIFLIFVLLLFLGWVEESSSVLRATTISLLIIVGKLLYRDINYLNLLCLSAMFSLSLNPLVFLSPGFQMTYFVTAFLICVMEKFRVRKGFLRKAFLISIAGFLASAPLNLVHFHRVNLLSPISNFLAIFIVPLIMFFGVLVLLGANFFLPFLSFLINMLLKLEIISKFIISVERIPLFLLLASLFFLLLGMKRRRILPGFISFAILAVSFLLPSKRWKHFETVFLDVGQAEAVLVKCPPHHAFLYDTGGSYNKSFDVGEAIVSPALWASGVRKLYGIFVSHYHPDHSGGLDTVMTNFRPELIFYSEMAIDETAFWKIIKSGKARRLRKGDRFKIGECRIEVLHPNRVLTYKTQNDNSLVLLVKYKNFSMLLTGDVGKSIEEKLLPDLQPVTVLQVPHHGSRSSTFSPFLEKIRPKIGVISAGKFNPFDFPAQEVILRLEKMGSLIFCTAEAGAVRIRTDGKLIQVDTCMGKKLILHNGF